MEKGGRKALVEQLTAAALGAFVPRGPKSGIPIIVLSGSGGIGKTTALEQMVEAVRRKGLRVGRLPTLGLAPRALDLDVAIERAVGTAREDSTPVLLIADPFDELWGLAGWLFKRASDPESPICGIVIASRQGPPRRFAAEVRAMGQLTEIVVPLLTESEAVSLCDDFGLSAQRSEELFRSLGGHPLSLALAAEHEARSAFPGDAMGRVRSSESVLEGLVRELPTPMHYEALLAALMVPHIDRDVLGALFPGSEEANVLFDFLFQLSFMAPQGGRLSAHDIVRRALLEDAQKRRPRRLASTYQRVYTELNRERGKGERETSEALAFLIMQHPSVRPMFAGADGLSVRIRDASAADIEQGVAVVSRVEGGACAELFRSWCQTTGARVEVFVDECGQMQGMLVLLLDEALAGGSRNDPVVGSFLSRAEEFGIPTGRSLARFWFSIAAYQSPSDPWVTVVNQAITRANIDVRPQLAATCHLLDPRWRDVVETLVLSVPGGRCDVVESATVPTALSLRAPPPGGDPDFLWKFLFSTQDEQIDEPLRLRSSPSPSVANAPASLSEREVTVVRLIAEGYRYDQIAERLGISLGTVRTYIRRAYFKLGVTTKSEATLVALRQGWLG